MSQIQQMKLRVLFTEVSGNAKTGPIPVAGLENTTCPAACPLKKDGCYAAYGPIAMHWRRLNDGTYTGLTWDQFLLRIRALWKGQPWRYGTFGDLPGSSNKIDAKMLGDLTAANKGKLGWAYTHKPVLNKQSVLAPANREAIKKANKAGFTVNLSANNLEHADELKKLGIAPVVTVLPANAPKTLLTPAGNRVVVCPAQTVDKINCARCGFCQKANRNVIIGFLAHGSGAKYADKLATN